MFGLCFYCVNRFSKKPEQKDLHNILWAMWNKLVWDTFNNCALADHNSQTFGIWTILHYSICVKEMIKSSQNSENTSINKIGSWSNIREQKKPFFYLKNLIKALRFKTYHDDSLHLILVYSTQHLETLRKLE